MIVLPPEVRDLRDKVRGYVREYLLPLESRLTGTDVLDDGELTRLQEVARQAGIWQVDVPRVFGGQEYGLLGSCVLYEELGWTKAAPFRGNELLGPRVGPILYSLDESQREKYLYPVLRGEKLACFAQTEPDAGSDPKKMSTVAVLKGDEYVVNGTKRFIGWADKADFVQLTCLVTGSPGEKPTISVLLVDTDSPGFTLVRPWHTMMGDVLWEINFDNVHVPAANLVGGRGEGFKLAQQWLTRNRVAKHGARSLGIAQRALEMMKSYAAQRETFGELLSSRQAVQFMIVDSEIELRAARSLVYEAAATFDAGGDIRNESYIAKIQATEVASRIVDRAIQVHGGLGLMKDLPLEYFYRQIRSVRITEGATEVLRWRLARNLMSPSAPPHVA